MHGPGRAIVGILIVALGAAFGVTSAQLAESATRHSSEETRSQPNARAAQVTGPTYSLPVPPGQDGVVTDPPSSPLPPRDRDRDRIPDIVDSCPTVAGNLKNGCPGELPADVRGRWRVNALLSQLLSLSVRAPLGSRIELRCSARRRGVCGFRARTVYPTIRRTTSLTRYFKGRRIFPARTSITVRVTRAEQSGIYERLQTRTGHRLPQVTRRCIAAGTGRIQRCT